MKYLWLPALVILVGIIPFSCSGPDETTSPEKDSFRLRKLHYENTDGEKAVTVFYYDIHDRNYMGIWHLEDSSRSSLNTHELDSAGRLLVKSRKFSDGLTSVQHFKYDGSGNLVWEDFSRSDSVTGEVSYEYGPHGRLVSAECRGLNGWFYGTINYLWDHDMKTGADLMRDSTRIGSITFTYMDDRLLTEVWDFNDQWRTASELKEMIFYRFAKEGIEIPFPQRVLHIVGPTDGKEKKKDNRGDSPDMKNLAP